jgi:hypothetical protein
MFMKRFSVLLLLIILTLFATAQKTTYTRIFSGNSYDEGVAAFRLPNNEIRLVGNTSSFGHGAMDIWLVALDSNGDFLWHKFYGTPEIEKASDAIMTPQGDIFIVGTTTMYYDKSYQLYFLGLDQYGQVIGSGVYGGAGWDFGYSICQTSDSTFALAGETYSFGQGQSDVYLLQLNRVGDTLWTRTFGGADEDRAFALKLAPDSNLLIAGGSKSFGNGSFDFYVLKTTLSGDTIWTKTYRHQTDAEYTDFVINPDSTITLCGYLKDANDTYRDIDLMHLSFDGDSLWDRSTSLAHGKDTYLRSIVRRPNGDYIMGGMTAYHPTKDVRLVKTDWDGWWISSVFKGTTKEDEEGHKVTKDTLNGEYYFITGTTRSYNIPLSGMLFIRFDDSLYADSTRMISLPTGIAEYSDKGTETLIYPNPTSDFVHIEFHGQHNGGVVQVLNMSGSRLIEYAFSAGNTGLKLDLSPLASGVYVLRFITSDGTFYRKIIKQ